MEASTSWSKARSEFELGPTVPITSPESFLEILEHLLGSGWLEFTFGSRP